MATGSSDCQEAPVLTKAVVALRRTSTAFGVIVASTLGFIGSGGDAWGSFGDVFEVPKVVVVLSEEDVFTEV